MKEQKQFSFSVIIPIYNTEDYIEECIDSIIDQTIGFKEHIQLILVNDGSPDGCGEICQRYKDQYPDNIIYIDKENGGVSSACNAGLEVATGKYINITGSDDGWNKVTFEEAFHFFEEHYDEIDVVTTRMFFFGNKRGPHILNYKYKCSDVIDLLENPEYCQASDGNCFFKADAISDLRFDEELANAEDAMFLNTVFLKRHKCGVLAKGWYKYRRRPGSSAASVSKYKRMVVEPKNFQLALYNKSIEVTGKVQPYIAYLAMYEMQWRLYEQPTPDITPEQLQEYEDTLKYLLTEIEDAFIQDQRDLNESKRAFVYKLKHGDDFYSHVTWEVREAIPEEEREEERGGFYNDVQVFDANMRSHLAFYIIESENGNMVMQGLTDMECLNVPYEIYAKDNKGNVYQPEKKRYPIRDMLAFNGSFINEAMAVNFVLPIEEGVEYRFYTRINNGMEMHLCPYFDWFAKFNYISKHAYWLTDGKMITFKKDAEAIMVHPYSWFTHVKRELGYWWEIARKSKDRKESLLLRSGYWLKDRSLRGKEVWLVSDRNYNATDNGAAFFKYASKHIDSNKIKMYFVLSKKSKDYPELRKYGSILNPTSRKYRRLLLKADKVISAHGDAAVTRPFFNPLRVIADLNKFKYVYLQHGILQGQLDWWLNSYIRNIKLFVTSTEMETQAVLSGNYGYTDKEVQNLGMTRFDELFACPQKKKLVFLPTWRAALAGNIIGKTRSREYVEDFKDTEYCKFYNALINDPRLVEAIKKHGYEAEFWNHPNFVHQYEDFQGNEAISVMEGTASYEKLLGESAIMVTDFSGVQFDFAYQRKPIVYSQFDNIYEEGNGHSYKDSYFDYETEGFGPVAKTVDETVDALIAIMENDGKMSDQYRARADEFFTYDDQNNAARVFAAVSKL